ncbi:MAG: cobyrinate a,c-diamide synthase [Thermosynechococcaceae cyanobacterium]
MAIIIAGERSGVGKTTVTLALLASLCRRSAQVQSFKVGPDYIDPMFHRAVTRRPCRNLDPILTSARYVQQCFANHSGQAEYSLIEGVMGLFDGAGGSEDDGSTAHIARLLNLPVVLIIDCSRLSHSVAAIVQGYRSFDPRLHLAGVVLNRVGSDRHLTLLQEALDPLNIPILGVLRRNDAISIPDRHLGLVPTDELSHLAQLFDQLAELGDQSFNWPVLLPLLSSKGFTCNPQPSVVPSPGPPVAIAIARDAAFNFYYEDNLDRLRDCGAELIEWSPLQNEPLPPQTQGLYLGGGFPEVFAQQLAHHKIALNSVRTALQKGLPTYAECGGLMYLCQTLTDLDGQTHSMADILPVQVCMKARLTLGYRRAIAQQATPLLESGLQVQGHEFHHSQLTALPQAPIYQLTSYHKGTFPVAEGWSRYQVHASYLHLHWGDRPELPQRWVQRCRQWIPNP